MTKRRVELRILGHTELSTGGNVTGGVVLRQPKRLALLGYLALAASGGFRRRDQIVALFWPEKDQLHARTQLRKAVYAMRGALGMDAFVIRGDEELRLNPDVVWCDAVEFRSACEARQWSRALQLYRGDLLDGLLPTGVGQEFETWLSELRASLREEAARAAWECSSLADLAGNRDEAIAMARRAIELKPDDEQGVRRLIAALDRYGDRAGALRTFEDWQQRLLSEYGAEPAPETRKLARQVQAPRKGESMETPTLLKPPVAAEHPPVVPTDPPTPGVGREQPRRRSVNPLTLVSAAAVILTVSLLGAFVAIGRPVFKSTTDVAVLPFRGSDSATSQLGESIAEEISTALAQRTELGVRSWARTHQVLPQLTDAAQIGRALAVSSFVEGSVLRDARRLHVRVRLISVKDGRAIWAQVYDLKASDVIAAHEEIAASVARQLPGVVRGPP